MINKVVDIKSLLSDKIYLTRKPSYYVKFIKVALSWYCTYLSKNCDYAETMEFTPIVFYECMKFIKLNLEKNVNLILDESEIKK